MCTVAACFVDQSRDRVLGKRGLCGNLYDNWSGLLCLAIYVPVSSSDSGLTHQPPNSGEATVVHLGCDRFARAAICADRQQTVRSFRRRRDAPAGKLARATRKDGRESATTATARIKGEEGAGAQDSAANQEQNTAAGGQ